MSDVLDHPAGDPALVPTERPGICAPQKLDLKEMLQQAATLPPLRARRDDIIPLAENYLKKIKAKMNTPLTSISQEAKTFRLGSRLSVCWK